MVNRKAIIVIGLGYGDEGKGLTTDYLCLKHENALVIRFNGGHQAGHCVVTSSGKKHIFSNLGSGTLRDVPTYWSSYCTFAPMFLLEELHLLELNTQLYVDNNCPITTHYDILLNRTVELTLGKKRNGSCGVGFGATINRQKDKVSLLFQDLFNEEKLERKLQRIKEFYRYKINLETAYNFDEFNHDREDKIFKDSIEQIKQLVSRKTLIPTSEKEMFNNKWSTYIFEGAQGIMLDKTFGEWPHVTKSNTTSKNALEIITRQNLNLPIEIFYVTRAYQTRHGAGPFKKTHKKFNLINNSTETNIQNEYQGEFKCNFLDIDDINYALKCDAKFSSSYSKNLMITCLDHFKIEDIFFYKKNKLVHNHYSLISKEFIVDFKNVKFSFSNCSENIK